MIKALPATSPRLKTAATQFVKMNTLLVFVMLSCLAASSTSTSGIRLLNGCSCSGQTVTFECVATGGALTVWSGSAFMCPRGEITLSHAIFLEAIGECNDGAIVGEGVAVDNTHNSYTSHLNVTLSSELLGRRVNCSTDGSSFVSIGSSILSINNTNQFPPPSKITVESIGPDKIIFSWSDILHTDCPSFRYNISSLNCGTCLPTPTTSNVSYCSNFSDTLFSSTNVCNFSVHNIICENIAGDKMSKVIFLKVPDSPILQSVPRYDARASSLIGLETSFTSVGSFNISDDPFITGSVTSYTITYTNFSTGAICASQTVLPSSCRDGICHHTFDIATASCLHPTNITVSVFASNILGDSQSSTVYQRGTNTFVHVAFETSTRSISCLFLNQSQRDRVKQCIANVTSGVNCDQIVGIYHGSGMGNSVSTPPLMFTDSVSEHCINVIAISGNTTVIVEQKLSLLTDTGTVAVPIVTILAIIVAIVVAVTVAIVLILVLYHVIILAIVHMYQKARQHKAVHAATSMELTSGDPEANKYFKKRTEAVQKLKTTDCHPYPHKFQTNWTLKEFNSKFNDLSPGERKESETVRLAGRIFDAKHKSSSRVIFYEIRQIDGTRVQIMADASQIGQDDFQELHNNIIKEGDIVGVHGFPEKTEGRELHVVAQKIKLLSPCLHPIQHLSISLTDKETRYRQRYLDLTKNDIGSEKFRTRAKIIAFLRKFLDDDGFLEVETPVMNIATGGVTHTARLFKAPSYVEQKVSRRVAPELYHKMLVLEGFERVYEIGKVLRNEGLDTTHNPEFTVCDFVMAYADYNDLMEYTERLLSEMVKEVKGGYTFVYNADESDGSDEREEYKVDFTPPFRQIRIIPELEKQLQMDFPKSNNEFLSEKFNKQLDELCKKHSISCGKPRSSARMLNKLIEHFIEKKCIEPTFAMDYPQILSPLAKWHRDDDSECLTERFELFVCKHKICNAYTELNDPEKQRELFKTQSQAGDVQIDENYCKALEYGLPPTAGWRMGVDRMAMLLTNSVNIKEVLFFPDMKPEHSKST